MATLPLMMTSHAQGGLSMDDNTIKAMTFEEHASLHIASLQITHAKLTLLQQELTIDLNDLRLKERATGLNTYELYKKAHIEHILEFFK